MPPVLIVNWPLSKVIPLSKTTLSKNLKLLFIVAELLSIEPIWYSSILLFAAFALNEKHLFLFPQNNLLILSNSCFDKSFILLL